MSKIVSGAVGPILAKDIRFSALVKMQIPVPVGPGIHCPRLISTEPLEVAPVTLDHAAACAHRVVDSMGNLPHTEQAGDLLAMAYAILHYEAKE